MSRNPDDVTWFGDIGLAFDAIDGGLTPEGRMTARAGRLVIVDKHSNDEHVVPAEIDAAGALELAQLLMLLASILDRAVVDRRLEAIREGDALRRLMMDPLPKDAATH